MSRADAAAAVTAAKPPIDPGTSRPPYQRVLVVLNAKAGTLAASESNDEPERIRRGLEAAGVRADVESVEGDRIPEVVRSAVERGYEAVIGGGGDGTLHGIANMLIGTDVAFGVLPLGTHNHFAKDLGIPLDLDDAVAALARGRIEDLSVAEVNGVVFLNFSAIGFHPALVRHREAQRRAHGRSKWLAMVVAFFRMLVRFPVMRAYLTSLGDSLVRNTPSVIVCNNPHQMEVFGVEDASIPERGLLNVYVSGSRGRAAFVWTMIKAMFGRLEATENFEVLALPEVTVDVWGRARGQAIHVSVDGEIADIRLPLHYKVHERGLKVICPPRPTTATPATPAAGEGAGGVSGVSGGSGSPGPAPD